MHPEASDAALWACVRADDEAAFAVVFDRYHPRVQRAVAHQLTDVARADVPAVASEVFHTAWQRRGSVEVDTSVWPWLRAVTTRLCANERRRCLRQDLLAERTVATGPVRLVEPDHAAFVTTHVAFTTALARLGAVEAQVAELAIVHDLSEAEVARRLRVPVGTVKSRLHRARRLLRQHLGPALDTLRATPPQRARPGHPAGVEPTLTDVAPARTAPGSRLDLWVPDAGGRVPLVVFVHRGARHGGTRADVAPKVRPLLDAGFGVAAVDHRSPAGRPSPTAVEEVAAAVRHLGGLDVVDVDRVALWGESAGAGVACVLGALGGRTPDRARGVGPDVPRVAAVVDWFGPVDDGPAGSPARGAAGPLAHLATADPATLPAFAIAHGTADRVVAPAGAERLVEALRAAGNVPWTTWLDGAGHGDARFDAELMIPTIDWLQQVLEDR